MDNIIDFIKQNYLNILSIVIVVISLLVIINLKGINLNPPKPQSKLIQEVTVETFDSGANFDSGINISKEYTQMKLQPSESFCESYLGKSSELEEECNKLTESNCAETRCCVFANYNKDNRKCVAGSINGPTYKTDKDGKLLTIDSYYYMGRLMPT
jgi:hypothetical protein